MLDEAFPGVKSVGNAALQPDGELEERERKRGRKRMRRDAFRHGESTGNGK